MDSNEETTQQLIERWVAVTREMLAVANERNKAGDVLSTLSIFGSMKMALEACKPAFEDCQKYVDQRKAEKPGLTLIEGGNDNGRLN